ncbi:hypothetical protein JOQ06_021052, partial [Pogonophryne albipinna]
MLKRSLHLHPFLDCLDVHVHFPELGTGQEGCLSEESTKHFKAAEDWQRQRDDCRDREGEAAHEKRAFREGKKERQQK